MSEQSVKSVAAESESDAGAAAAEALLVKNPLRDFAAAYHAAQSGSKSSSEEVLDDDEEVSPAEKLPRKSGKVQAKTLAALAEKLSVDVADLYNIQIPMRNGETPKTLGELKDAVAGHSDYEVAVLKWETERRKQLAELSRSRLELEELMSSLPADALKPEKVAKVRARLQAKQQQERVLTLETIPEWRDEAQRESELVGMVEHLQDYGFPETYLADVSDHRMLRYIRESWVLHKRLQAALDRVSERKPATPPKADAQETAPRRRAPAMRSRSERQVGRFMETIHQAAKQR